MNELHGEENAKEKRKMWVNVKEIYFNYGHPVPAHI